MSPADRIAAARLALDELDEAESSQLAGDMRSQLRDHGRPTSRTSILVHGLTASPRMYEQLADELFARGHTVVIPRVVRHGHADRMTRALGDLSRDELAHFAQRIVAIAELLGGRTTVLGQSLGGLISLWIAQRYEIARAIAVAPFLGVHLVPHELHGVVLRIIRKAPNQFVFWDPVQRERQMPEHGYPRYATYALASAVELADELRESAGAAPPRAASIELVLNASETSVSNRTARDLASRWTASGYEAASVHSLQGLPPSHDIIEPYRGHAERVYPTLLDLADPPE